MIIKKEKIKINFARKEDLDSIYSLDKKYFLNFYDRNFYFDNILDKRVIVAKLENKIIGYIIFTICFDESELLKIVVDKEYRNLKVGSNLVFDYLEFINKDMLRKSMLEVRESNDKAINLYKKFNFKVVRKIKNYYTEPIEDGLFMIRGN